MSRVQEFVNEANKKALTFDSEEFDDVFNAFFPCDDHVEHECYADMAPPLDLLDDAVAEGKSAKEIHDRFRRAFAKNGQMEFLRRIYGDDDASIVPDYDEYSCSIGWEEKNGTPCFYMMR